MNKLETKLLSLLCALCILFSCAAELAPRALAGDAVELTRELTASDDQTYRITVSYDTDCGIPANAKLRVKEVSADSRKGARYVSETAELLNYNAEALTYTRLFDISLRGPLGVEYQPDSSVQVRIELLDRAAEPSGDLRVVHFGKEAEVMDADASAGALEFKTGSFSLYAVVGGVYGDESDPATYSIKFEFKDDQGDPYKFPNKAGVMVDFQYVANGEKPFSPGTPTKQMQEGIAFVGWYGKEGNVWDAEATISANGEAKTVSVNANGSVKVLYARYERVYHVYYFDEFADGINDPDDPNYVATDTVYRIDVVEAENAGQTYHTQDASGEYKIDYLPSSSAKAFLGWSDTPGGTTAAAVVESYSIPTEGVLKLYPVIADVYWIYFDKNDDNTGASYVAPIFVYKGNTLASRVTEIPKSERPGYTFVRWNLPDGQQLTTSYRPTADVTVTAQWNPKANQTYNVVYWTQVPTDEVGLADDAKTYVYDHTVTRTGQTGSNVTLSPNDQTINSTNIKNEQNPTSARFTFNSTKSSQGATIEADGSTVLNVYYDRVVHTLHFQINGQYSGGYVPATDDSGTQYGLVNDEYVQLTYRDGKWYYGTGEFEEGYTQTNSTADGYYYISDGNGGYSYVYLDFRDNGRNVRVYQVVVSNSTYSDYYFIRDENGVYTQVYLYRYNNRWYRTRTGRYPNYTYSDEYTGAVYERSNSYTSYSSANVARYTYGRTEKLTEYTGIRYKQQPGGNGWHDIKTIHALYGHHIFDDFPIVGSNGVTYNQGQRWMPSPQTQNGSIFNDVIVYIETMPSEDRTFHLDTGSHGTKTMHYYVEALPTDTEDIVTYNGIRFKKYKTLTANLGYFVRDLDWLDLYGYSKYDSNPQFPSSGKLGSDVTTITFYYRRNTFDVEFYDGFPNEVQPLSANGSAVTLSIPYGGSLSSAQNVISGEVGDSAIHYGNNVEFSHTGYTFNGWYKDSACTEPFDFSGEMQNHSVRVYAGWKKLRYRVWVQPNGGILSETESTYFRADWSELIREYEDVKTTGRNFVQAKDGETGEYSYVYICDAMGETAQAGESHIDDARVAYYKKTAELGWVTLYNTDGTEKAVYNEAYHTDGKTYKEAPAGTYSFIGWYQVRGPIDENYAPPASRSVTNVWNFASPVKASTAIRAMWVREGTYTIQYTNTLYDEEGAVLLDGYGNEVTSPDPAPNDENVYQDLAQAVAPAPIRPAAPYQNYVFAGWLTPDGELHQPGETFMIRSDYATVGSNGAFSYPVKPVFKLLGTVKLVYDLNGGSPVDGDSFNEDCLGAAYGGDSNDTSGTSVVRYSTSDATKPFMYNITANSRVTLSAGRCIGTNKLLVKDGYLLTGWNTKADPAEYGAVHFTLGGVYAIGPDSDGNDTVTLYAEWTPVVFDLSFTKLGEKIADDFSSSFDPLNGAVFSLNSLSAGHTISGTGNGTQYLNVQSVQATSAKVTLDGEEKDGIVLFEKVVPFNNSALQLEETLAPNLPDGSGNRYDKDPKTYQVSWTMPASASDYHFEIVYGIKCVWAESAVILDASADPDDQVVTEIKNKWPSTTVQILKIDAEPELDENGLPKTDENGLYVYKPLENAEFTLMKKNAGGTFVPYPRGGHENGIYKTDENGYVEAELLFPGEYTLQETKAPDQYKGYEPVMNITADNLGAVTMTGGTNRAPYGSVAIPFAEIVDITEPTAERKTYALTVGNIFNCIDIRFMKIDGYGEPVVGAMFVLYQNYACTMPLMRDASNAYFGISADGTTFDSDGKAIEKGEVVIEDVPNGVWYMKEINNPDPTKYVTNTNVYIVLVGEAALSLDATNPAFKPELASLTADQVLAQRGTLDPDTGKYEHDFAAFLLVTTENSEGTAVVQAVACDDTYTGPDIAHFGVINVSPAKRKVILKAVDDGYNSLSGGTYDLLRSDMARVADDSINLNAGTSGGIWVGMLPLGKYYLHESAVPSGYSAGSGWFEITVSESGTSVVRLSDAPGTNSGD